MWCGCRTQTDTAKAQSDENTKVGETTTREGEPGSFRNEVNSVYYGRNSNQVERYRGGQGRSNKAKSDWLGTPNENIVKNCINWGNDEDDPSWNGEKTLGLEIST
jgi:hypothetical protein